MGSLSPSAHLFSCEALGTMPRSAVIVTLMLAASLAPTCNALDNGQNLRPPMGWNTWYEFTPPTEQAVRRAADLLVELGLADDGYQYIVVDEDWQERSGRVNGTLTPDATRFPSGMKALGEYIHAKGLKFGTYSNAGQLSCNGNPGTRGFEEQDAQMFADWGSDYFKYDNCHNDPEDWIVDRYIAMRDALNKTGRPMVFSMCEWGVAEPWLWAQKVGNSWRTTDDISPTWDSILEKLDKSTGLARFAGPGAWNDLDILQVGRGMLSLGEQRAHFALWSLLKSPLMIGADLDKTSPESLAILMAREVIAVHQDELGVAGELIWKQGSKEIYAAPLADGSRAVVLFYRLTVSEWPPEGHLQYTTTKLTVHWEQLGLDPDTPSVVRDLYREEDLGQFSGSFTGIVSRHDVVALRITPLSSPGGSPSWRPWHRPNIYGRFEEVDSRMQFGGLGGVTAS